MQRRRSRGAPPLLCSSEHAPGSRIRRESGAWGERVELGGRRMYAGVAPVQVATSGPAPAASTRDRDSEVSVRKVFVATKGATMIDQRVSTFLVQCASSAEREALPRHLPPLYVARGGLRFAFHWSSSRLAECDRPDVAA